MLFHLGITPLHPRRSQECRGCTDLWSNVPGSFAGDKPWEKWGESSWYTNNHWGFWRWNNFATWISCLVLHESMSSKILCYLCQCSIELLRSWPFLHLYSRKRWIASLFMATPIDHNKIIIWLVVQVCPFDKTGDSLEIMKNPYNKYETNENSIHIEAM